MAMAVTRRRPRIRWVVVPVCLLIAAVIGGLPVYVRPQVDPLRHADAILVLGGDGFSRYRLGIDLGMQGWAPKVILSNPGTDDEEWLTKACNTPPSGIKLDCFVPDPPTTVGEGRELRRLAERHRWRSVIVVTFTPHISRARFILQRCFDGELIMVASPTHISLLDWPVEYVYQTAGYVRAALQPGC